MNPLLTSFYSTEYCYLYDTPEEAIWYVNEYLAPNVMISFLFCCKHVKGCFTNAVRQASPEVAI